MRKVMSIATVGLLGVLALSIGGGADAREPRRAAEEEWATSERVSELPALMKRMDRRMDRISAILAKESVSLGRVRCTTVACLNRELTKLSRFAKQTAKRLNKLDRVWNAWHDEWDSCVPVMPVTQYPGYMYTTNGTTFSFPTTGLDYTEEGSEVTNWFLVWTCGVQE